MAHKRRVWRRRGKQVWLRFDKPAPIRFNRGPTAPRTPTTPLTTASNDRDDDSPCYDRTRVVSGTPFALLQGAQDGNAGSKNRKEKLKVEHESKDEGKKRKRETSTEEEQAGADPKKSQARKEEEEQGGGLGQSARDSQASTKMEKGGSKKRKGDGGDKF